MINSDQAIEKAFSFVGGLKPEYLGAKPERMRLETIQRFGKEWVVVLSYFIGIDPKEENIGNKFLQALSSRRFIKEVEIDSETGEVVAMRNPEAPATTGEAIPA